MCGPSKVAKKMIDAKVGDVFKVDKNIYGQGAFVPPNTTVAECVACMRGDDQLVTFANIPGIVQKDYGVGKVAIGRFIEVNDPNGSHHLSRDMVDFGNDHGQVDLVLLVGAHAYVGKVIPGSGGYAKLMSAAGIPQDLPIQTRQHVVV